jgi:hypothetical protein
LLLAGITYLRGFIMAFISDNITSEGLLAAESLKLGITATTVSASTQVLLVGSKHTQIYTGSTAGQVVKMPDATTLLVGYSYTLINDATQNVTVQDSASGAILLLLPNQRVTIFCTNTGSAAGAWSYATMTKTATGKGDFETSYPGTGLAVSYSGGVYRFNGTSTQVAAGTITLPASTTGTLYVDVDGVVKATASIPDGAMPLYAFITNGSSVTTLTDAREDYENNNTYGVVGDITATTASNIAAAGTLNKTARADHKHASTLPLYKSGTVAAGSFAGTPKTYSVVFGTPYADANYSVTITGEDGRVWKAEVLATTGFIINTGAGTALTGNVYWQTIKTGESV